MEGLTLALADKPYNFSPQNTLASKQDAKVRWQKLDRAAERACSLETRVTGSAPPPVPWPGKPSSNSSDRKHSKEGWGA